MSNDYKPSKNCEDNDEIKLKSIIKPKEDISILSNRLKNLKNYNKSNNFNGKIINNSKIQNNSSLNKNFNFKKENKSLNNISSFNRLFQNPDEKVPLVKNIFKKLKKINSPNQEKYANAILFKYRISKHSFFSSRNKSDLYKSKIDIGNNKNSIENDISNNNQNNCKSKKYFNLKNCFLSPTKRKIDLKIYEASKNNSFNNIHKKYYSALQSPIKGKNPENFSSRVNSSFILPRMNSFNSLNNSSILLDREKEKFKINENLKKLFYKINKKIMPKKRIVLIPSKLPSILNKNKDIKENSKSCIHKMEYGDYIIFEKTHLDDFEEEKTKDQKEDKNIGKYEINEGYIDLNVLNSGSNISFKTNLKQKDGIYFYEFNKSGRMETIEEKVHKVIKDKKEFRKLLERFQKEKLLENMKNKDFAVNIKSNYGAGPIINKNIYRDLFQILFKKRKIKF